MWILTITDTKHQRVEFPFTHAHELYEIFMSFDGKYPLDLPTYLWDNKPVVHVLSDQNGDLSGVVALTVG